MATPHVVGLAAYLLGLSDSGMTPAALKSQIQELSVLNAVNLLGHAETPNRLAFNGVSS
jgi:hypothetical protein